MNPGTRPDADDCRCLCGSLVARLVDGAVELKCRRCKRTLRVALEPAAARPDRPLRPRVVSASEAG